MKTLTDTSILEQLKQGNSSSFDLLYENYFPSIANYIKQNLGSHQDAEDVFQEAMIVLIQNIKNPNFILSSSLKTYLYAIAKNLWLKKIRDNKINVSNSEFNLSLEDSQDGFNNLDKEEPIENKVENWLQKITQNCQNILKAIFFYQVPMEKVMTKMGWKNKHTASNQKYKCIQQIKKVKENEN